MNALILGCKGMLGSALAAVLSSRSHDVIGLGHDEFDVSNPESSARLASGEFGAKFDWVFNCAAYTAVDKAETECDKAFLVNAIGPGYLAQACSMAGMKLMHLSTDFVFDGTKGEPYREEDPTNPLGVYGESKLEGEKAVLSAGAVVVRTSWLFGPAGSNFPKTIIRAWKEGKHLRVVADQFGSPTYTIDLARVLVELAEQNVYPGIYHAAGPEATSWFEFAQRVLRAYESEGTDSSRSLEIEPIRTEDWPTAARRPKYSVLCNYKIEQMGIAPMRPLDDALSDFAKVCD